MIVFDLEADGLPHDVSTIHCMVLYNTEEDSYGVFNDQGTGEPITRAITLIEEADRIAGHNIINYDLRVIKKLYPFFEPQGEIIDTLLLSKLYHPDMYELDNKQKWKDMPTKLYGRHSLLSYGYRLGEYKGDYGQDADWKEWSQEMQDYCKQDFVVSTKLCDHFHPYLSGSR